VNLTGNPFVDAGFGVAACEIGRQSIVALSSDDLRRAVGKLHTHIETLRSFKILASFWVNNPFMGKNLGQRPKFEAFLRGLETGGSPTRAGYCQICGRSPVINVAATGCQADRCWFPLAGSGDSDPCTLPGLRSKAVCADCMCAVVVLPIGCRSCPDGPYFIHVTEPDLQVEAVSEGAQTLAAALSANAGDAIRHGTDLRGRVGLLDIVSGSILWDHSQPGHMTRIPQSGATAISFSNRGEGPSFNELHLPAQALEFFAAITGAGLRRVFHRWAVDAQDFARKTKRKYYLDELCGVVEERRSLAPLLVSLIRRREERLLRKGERKVLEIYEDVALRRKERFDTLQRVADRVRQMDSRYADSFIKQLGNLGSKRTLLELLKDFCRRESTGLKVTSSELRVINDGPVSETADLLFLLCIAEEDEGGHE
jgi:hypothetical protein